MKSIAVLVALVFAAVSNGSMAAEPILPVVPIIIMDTSMGILEIELNPEKAPETVNNFLGDIRAHFYDGTVFHRVTKQPAIIQGGIFTTELISKKPRAPIKNEAENGLKNERGTLAMARAPGVNSANAEFYINTDSNPGLDHVNAMPVNFGYCVFGKVIQGMDVVDKIQSVKTATLRAKVHGEDAALEMAPVNAVLINSIKEKTQ